MIEGDGPLDFDDLMNRVKNERCESSFKTIFETFYGKILSYFKFNKIDTQKSTELAQEVMISVWQKAHLYDGEKGSFKVWLYTIARNLRFDYFRSNSKELLTVASEEVYEHIEDQSQELDSLILNQGIREKINELPPDQKHVIDGVYFNGSSHIEYAEQNNIPLGTVKSRIRLALAQLKKGMVE